MIISLSLLNVFQDLSCFDRQQLKCKLLFVKGGLAESVRNKYIILQARGCPSWREKKEFTCTNMRPVRPVNKELENSTHKRACDSTFYCIYQDVMRSVNSKIS